VNLIAVGMNHHSAPVELRERYAVAAAHWAELNQRIVGSPTLHEALVISTCNRTELVAAAEVPDKGLEELESLLRLELGDGSALASHVYRYVGREVVHHVFRVAAGLDSMVLGEPQILGQVKAGYLAAARAGSLGPLLSRLFHRAFRAAKRVRSETGLGSSSTSLARVGVQLAREIFESFQDKRVLLIGAGEMAESALHGFYEAGVRDVCVLNRTLETAVRLAARYGARSAGLGALGEELAAADVALTSVAVDRPLLTPELVQTACADRQGRPLLLVDLGLPRNVAPAVNNAEGVYLYDVDDLSEAALRGAEERRSAVPAAEAILALELEGFERWYAAREVVPTIRKLVERVRELARQEAARTAAQLGADEPTRAALERMADAIAAKLSHRPIAQLRAEASEGQPPFLAEAVREIFGLEEDEG
jgi:glutamyl-tRNA reductase